VEGPLSAFELKRILGQSLQDHAGLPEMPPGTALASSRLLENV